MSSTVTVDISTENWVEIVNTGSGFITNESDNIIIYRESDNLPSPLVTNGHTLQRKDKVRYRLPTNESVYARAKFPMLAIDATPFVLITPD